MEHWAGTLEQASRPDRKGFVADGLGTLAVVHEESHAQATEQGQCADTIHGTDPRLVLMQGAIQALMAGGFDPPVMAAQGQEGDGVQALDGTAGDEVLAGRGGPAFLRDCANEQNDLGGPRQAQLNRGDGP